MSEQNKYLFELQNVSKIYGESAETKVIALDNINLKIEFGEFTSIVGPSGSGKSTLLNILSGLDSSSKGLVKLNGKDLSQMRGAELADFRRDHIGLIFQSYNLIPVLTVKENVEYVMILKGASAAERSARVAEVLREVGLEGKENRFPKELSGGQQQRVAVARAIATKPEIILADEPTANLDSKMGTELVETMKQLNEKYQTTFIFSTHDTIIMDRAKRLVVLKDGKIVEDSLRRQLM